MTAFTPHHIDHVEVFVRDLEASARWEIAWDFEGARRHHLRLGLQMTPAERLRWLEETVDEMRRLQGLARRGRRIGA